MRAAGIQISFEKRPRVVFIIVTSSRHCAARRNHESLEKGKHEKKYIYYIEARALLPYIMLFYIQGVSSGVLPSVKLDRFIMRHNQ